MSTDDLAPHQHELPNGRRVALGRPEVKTDSRTFRLARLLIPEALPPLPDRIVNSDKARWGLYGNDRLGDCLVGSTEVSGPLATSGMRAKYRGPIITLELASGKRLTVTPNHAVLTPRGFLPARLLNQGDHVVSCAFPQQVTTALKPNFNQPPAPIEKILAPYLTATPHTFREIVPLPVDFDGDGRFMYGNVDVVGADGFLNREVDYATLSEPDGQYQVGSSGQLERMLHRPGSALSRANTRRSAALGLVGGGRNSHTVSLAHSGVAHADGLQQCPRLHAGAQQRALEHLVGDAVFANQQLRRLAGLVPSNGFAKVGHRTVGVPKRDSIPSGANLYASSVKPTAETGPTDPQLPSQLAHRFPGSVTLECVSEIYANTFSGHVYDLSTEQRWYIADGIVTHNCTAAGIANLWSLNAVLVGQSEQYTDDDVIRFYSATTGYNPADSSTDQGAVELDVLNYLRRNPFGDDKLAAFASVDTHDTDLVRHAIQLFGAVYIGLSLPRSAQAQDGGLWDVGGGPDGAAGSWGGHCVIVTSFDFSTPTPTLECITWGGVQRMTLPFWQAYCDESYGLLTDEWRQKAPAGFDFDGLDRMLAQVGRVQA